LRAMFFTIIFPRKDVGIKPEDVGINTKIKKLTLTRILKLLDSLREENFSVASFAKEQGTSLRTVERDIELLRVHGLIALEGARKKGNYKLTKKGHKNLEKLSAKKRK